MGSDDVDDGERRRGVAAAGIEQPRAEHRADVEVDDLEVLAELRRPSEEVAVVVHDERRAVEDQLVLPADHVDVDDVAVGVLGPGGHHSLALAVPTLRSTAIRSG